MIASVNCTIRINRELTKSEEKYLKPHTTKNEINYLYIILLILKTFGSLVFFTNNLKNLNFPYRKSGCTKNMTG